MGNNTSIQWTDHTLNFWTGCKKVSPGCKYCYMYRDLSRYGKDPEKVNKVSMKTINKVLRDAIPGDKIFVCSWSDFFIDAADQWRKEAWEIMKSRPDLIFQILTKRPERIEANLPKDWGNGYPNVWLGVTIESNGQRDRLIKLHSIKNRTSAFKTFVSYEPAIDYLDLASIEEFRRIDWIIIGGESGNDNGLWKYRPCKLDWLEGICHQARCNQIPVFVKQMGTYLSKIMSLQDRHGGHFSEFPDNLKFRQFPL